MPVRRFGKVQRATEWIRLDLLRPELKIVLERGIPHGRFLPVYYGSFDVLAAPLDLFVSLLEAERTTRLARR